MSFKISFFTVRSCRTLGVLVATGPNSIKSKKSKFSHISAYKRRRSGTRTFTNNGLADDPADGLIQPKHIQKNLPKLRKVETTDRCASCHVSLQNVGQDLNIVHAAEDVHILSCLNHERIPLQKRTCYPWPIKKV